MLERCSFSSCYIFYTGTDFVSWTDTPYPFYFIENLNLKKKIQIIHKAFKIWEGLTEVYSNELSHDLDIYWYKLHCFLFSIILFNMFTFTATNASFPFSTRSFVSPSHTIPNDPWPNSRNKHTFSLSTSHSSGI